MTGSTQLQWLHQRLPTKLWIRHSATAKDEATATITEAAWSLSHDLTNINQLNKEHCQGDDSPLTATIIERVCHRALSHCSQYHQQQAAVKFAENCIGMDLR